MVRVYLGLGTNLGDRETNLAEARAALLRHGITVYVFSPLYETKPWGVLEQPLFLNAACAAETDHSPHALLDVLKTIEREMGRVATVRYGPRIIDLDILLYDDLRISTPRLVIPHAGMLQRASVLVPLADVAPDVRHPVSGLTIAEHLACLGATADVAPYPPGLRGVSHEPWAHRCG
jgi:2-amino-4-hydroxy-6-hydroxymethyldihydropteridine diphosphokinase